MPNANFYRQGSYNFICDRCGQKKKREDGQREWSGTLVCLKCWDPKHPWLLPVPMVVDGLPVSDARPRPNAPDLVSSFPTLSIWGVQYQRLNGDLSPNLRIDDWDEIIGGSGTIPFNATNFPLR